MKALQKFVAFILLVLILGFVAVGSGCQTSRHGHGGCQATKVGNHHSH